MSPARTGTRRQMTTRMAICIGGGAFEGLSELSSEEGGGVREARYSSYSVFRSHCK